MGINWCSNIFCAGNCPRCVGGPTASHDSDDSDDSDLYEEGDEEDPMKGPVVFDLEGRGVRTFSVSGSFLASRRHV